MKKSLFFFCVLCLCIKVYPQFGPCSEQVQLTGFQESECTLVQVPLDHEVPTGPTIDLFVRKFPSLTTSKGSLWLIPGGPGESGASLYPLMGQFHELFPDLDIFVPDHRGTGLSSKICPEEESMESEGGISLVGKEWGSCFGYMFQNRSYVQAFSITNAAKDLQYLIHEVGTKGKQYIYGVSYGTQLVLRMLQLDGVELDGVILDSLVPEQENDHYDLSHRSHATDEVGKQVLKRFQEQESTGEPTLLYQMVNVVRRSRKDSVFIKNLHNQQLTDLFGMFLDVPKTRNQLPKVISGLYVNDFEPFNTALNELQEFYKTYAGDYATSPNSIPLVQVISSSENNLRPKLIKEDVKRESQGFLFTSPLPYLLAENSMPTYPTDTYFGKEPKTMPPTLVLQGTLDPKTPLDGAIQHVGKWSSDNRVSLVKVKDAPHFIALFAPDAFKTSVTAFLQQDPLNQIVEDSHVVLQPIEKDGH